MPALPAVIVVTSTVTPVLGVAITAVTYRACRRTGSPALRHLAVCFAALTVAVPLVGVGSQLFAVPPTPGCGPERRGRNRLCGARALVTGLDDGSVRRPGTVQ